MPTYEYNCPHCGTPFEAFCKVVDRMNQKCPECDNIGTKTMRTPPVPHWTSLAMGSSASPEALKKFETMRRDQKHKEEKSMREHGDYGVAPGS